VIVAGVFWIAASRQQSSPAPSAPTVEHVAIGAPFSKCYVYRLERHCCKAFKFQGKSDVLVVATWCSSCSEGAKVLSQNESKLGNLTIITLKTYGNAGYPGPKIGDFAVQSAPSTLHAKNWHWGNLTKQSTKVYNPRNYPDIYFLIDKNGIVRDINDAPAATLGTIIKFAQN